MEVREISLNKIKLGENSRLVTNNEDLSGLMESINQQGLLQPVGAVEGPNGTFELAYGNRRFMACSRLGWKKIPAKVIKATPMERDMMNLTENVQRKTITLIEAGRFVKLLQKHGLAQKEIAVRMGVSASYINSCIQSHDEVPTEYQKDIEVFRGKERPASGKLSVSTARRIVNQQKTYRLTKNQTSLIFEAAKKDSRFNEASVPAYAIAIKRGHEDTFMDKVKPFKTIRLNLIISTDEFDRLTDKFVTDGPFRSVTEAIRAILSGKKSDHVKLIV